MICSLSCFTCILLVRRYVPGASKHWLCRTPHICVGTLVLVTFLQCLGPSANACGCTRFSLRGNALTCKTPAAAVLTKSK